MDKLLTSDQAAEVMCIAPVTLRKWRWEGKGPIFVKVGRKVAYRLSDIETWLHGQLRNSTSDMGV